MTTREHRTWWLIIAALALAAVFACRWAAASETGLPTLTVQRTAGVRYAPYALDADGRVVALVQEAGQRSAGGPSSEPQTTNPAVKKLELAAYHAWNAAEDAWLEYAEACEAYRKGSVWSPSEYLWRQVERTYGHYVDARVKFYRLQGRWLRAKHRAGEL